jgi:hypothetical protein
MNVEKIIGLRKWDIMIKENVVIIRDKYKFSIFTDEIGRPQKLMVNDKDILLLDALDILAEEWNRLLEEEEDK